MAVPFAVGTKFASFEDLETTIKKFETDNLAKLYKRDSRTIVTAQKRVSKPINPALKYYELVYACIQGGKKFKSEGTGKKSSQTFRNDCPWRLSLRACVDGDNDGQSLVVREFTDSHNHEMTKVLYDHMPCNRKLTGNDKERAAELLALGSNKKLVQQKLSQQTGKIVLLKDLSNIAAEAKSAQTRNNIEKCVNLLTEKYAATVELFIDDDDKFRGLFFVDKQMQDTYRAYPEIIFVDATYKLLELRLPVFVCLCEDSNGQSEVIAVCLLVSEDAESLQWMLTCLKDCNPEAWPNTRVVMADKDLKERDVIKKSLPNVPVLICLFHSLRSFRREVTCEKMGITSAQRTMCLENIQQMAYARSEEKYVQLRDAFKQNAPPAVWDYFSANWDTIHDEWVLGLTYATGNFLNTTNNRLESLNAKFKSVINRYSTLEDFIVKFFVILTTLRTERDHKASIQFTKIKVTVDKSDTPQYQYRQFLTDYASRHVITELDMVKKVILQDNNDGTFIAESADKRRAISTDDHCNCSFNRSMRLPCSHILAVRKRCNQSLFSEGLCAQRWTSSYYRSTQRIFLSSHATPTLQISTSSSKRKALSQHEKFNAASHLASDLASLTSEMCGQEYHERMVLLKSLAEEWRNGKTVILTTLDTHGDVPALQPDPDVHEVQECDGPVDVPVDPAVEVLQQEDQAADLERLMESLTSTVPAQQSSVMESLTSTVPAQQSSVMESLTSTVPAQQSSLMLKACPAVASAPQTCRVESPDLSHTTTETIDDGGDDLEALVEILQEENKQVDQQIHEVNFKEIKMPARIKRRGRPKGAEMTTIGLPRKRSKGTKNTSFRLLHTSEKEKVMLRWVLREPLDLDDVIRGKSRIDCNMTKACPDDLPAQFLDENVDIYLIRRYFTTDAWKFLENMMREKRSTYVQSGPFNPTHLVPNKNVGLKGVSDY